MAMESSEKKSDNTLRRGNKGPRMAVFVGAIVLAAAVGLGSYYFAGGFKDKNSDEVVIENVGKHIVLPDEKPNITTVEQAGELAKQAFFAEVKDGDKILIFPQSARIIIFRPSENILVNVGPIVDDSATKTGTDSTKTE